MKASTKWFIVSVIIIMLGALITANHISNAKPIYIGLIIWGIGCIIWIYSIIKMNKDIK